MKTALVLIAAAVLIFFSGRSISTESFKNSDADTLKNKVEKMNDKNKVNPKEETEHVCTRIERTDEEWQKILNPEQYKIMREKGTEAPFTGVLYNNKEKGVYVCAACGTELFSSDTKFESGTGWPSFFSPIKKENIAARRDTTHGMIRTEVLCAACDAHLGHVFDDGPAPTKLRFCINSGALKFVKK